MSCEPKVRPATSGNLHDVEVAGANDVVLDIEIMVDRYAGDNDVAVPTAFVKGEVREAGRAHTVKGAHPLFDLLIKRWQSRVIFLVAGRAGVDLQTKDILLVEAGVDVVEVNQAAQEESGADHEDQGKRNLRDDQRAGERTLPAYPCGLRPAFNVSVS